MILLCSSNLLGLMFTLFKKTLSCALILFIITGQSVVVSAAGSLSINPAILNGFSGNVGLNPGDTFSINLAGLNDGTEALTSVYGKLWFSTNSMFSFVGNLQTLSTFSVINSSVPLTDYSSTGGLVTQITGTANASIVVGKKPKLATIGTPAGLKSFAISQNIATYQNTVYGQMVATDASLNTVTSSVSQATLFVNVRPHITDYYFEK